MAQEFIEPAILECYMRGDDAVVSMCLGAMSSDEVKAFLMALVGLANRVSSEMLRGKGE